jgi:hypothetical protein
VTNDKDRSTPRPPQRSSPAVNVTRPLFLAAIVLLAYPLHQASPTRFVIVAGLVLLGALVAFVTHTAFSRRKEENRNVRCG